MSKLWNARLLLDPEEDHILLVNGFAHRLTRFNNDDADMVCLGMYDFSLKVDDDDLLSPSNPLDECWDDETPVPYVPTKEGNMERHAYETDQYKTSAEALLAACQETERVSGFQDLSIRVSKDLDGMWTAKFTWTTENKVPIWSGHMSGWPGYELGLDLRIMEGDIVQFRNTAGSAEWSKADEYISADAYKIAFKALTEKSGGGSK